MPIPQRVPIPPPTSTAPRTPRRRPSAVAGVLATVLLAACSSTGRPIAGSASDLGRPGPGLEAAAVPAQLAAIEADLGAGAAWAAARRAAALRRATALGPDERDEVEGLLEMALEAAAAATDDPRVFARFDEDGLPRRASAILAIGEARALLGRGEAYEAFREVRRFEQKYPGHHLRADAASIVYEAGTRLAASKQRTLLFFERSTYAPMVLEYLVLNHPSHPSCADAYVTLADFYAERNQLERAVARYEDLLLYHPRHPAVPRAEATIPSLRLQLHLRDDYDRRNLERARRELERWLRTWADAGVDPELVEAVRLDLADCLGRLVNNDLAVARFYRRVDEPEGARLHALRALSTARLAGYEELIADAEALAVWADEELAARAAAEALDPLPPTPRVVDDPAAEVDS